MLGRTFLLEFVSLQSKECGCVEQRVWVTAKGVEDDEIVEIVPGREVPIVLDEDGREYIELSD